MKNGWQYAIYSDLRHARNWLVTVLGLAKLVEEIYIRHTPEEWQRYKDIGVKHLAEQVELNRRIQHLQMFLNKNKPKWIVKCKPSTTTTVTYTVEVSSVEDMKT